MKADLADLNAFLSVARARGFRDAARAAGNVAMAVSDGAMAGIGAHRSMMGW